MLNISKFFTIAAIVALVLCWAELMIVYHTSRSVDWTPIFLFWGLWFLAALFRIISIKL